MFCINIVGCKLQCHPGLLVFQVSAKLILCMLIVSQVQTDSTFSPFAACSQPMFFSRLCHALFCSRFVHIKPQGQLLLIERNHRHSNHFDNKKLLVCSGRHLRKLYIRWWSWKVIHPWARPKLLSSFRFEFNVLSSSHCCCFAHQAASDHCHQTTSSEKALMIPNEFQACNLIFQVFSATNSNSHCCCFAHQAACDHCHQTTSSEKALMIPNEVQACDLIFWRNKLQFHGGFN